MSQENIYGHKKRLQWIISHLKKHDRILEFGCGTGVMITLPLAEENYCIRGLDLDKESINFGKNLFLRHGLNPEILINQDVSNYKGVSDVIIASEVLEHILDKELDSLIELLRNKLAPNGRLLITVPNGYGCFELDSFLWNRVGLGRLIEWMKLDCAIRLFKSRILGSIDESMQPPSTLSSSGHVQRFTYNGITRLLKKHGFKIIEIKGSSLIAGPFANLLFTGINSIMNINNFIGTVFPCIASGFYVACQLPAKDNNK